MQTNAFREAWIAEILSRDDSTLRFENFAIELLSEFHQVTYFPTSRSWDMARDGKTLLHSAHTKPRFLCVSIEARVDDKAEADIKRNVAHASPESITFCTSQRMSEHAVDQLKAFLRETAPNVETIEIINLNQLPRIISPHVNVFEKYYPGELAALRSALMEADDKEKEFQISGMRIALTTQFQDDALRLRSDIIRNLILTALEQKPKQTIKSLAKNISDSLAFGRSISEAYFQDQVDQLFAMKVIDSDGSAYWLTDKGAAEDERRLTKGSASLLEGRRLVEAALTELLGTKFTDEEFAKLWGILQDEFANLFLTNGLAIVHAISSLLGRESRISGAPTLADHLRHLKETISQSGIAGARSGEVAQAVIDLFHETSSAAFDWLTRLATIYIGLCSLGLEPSAHGEVANRLREIDLIPDTDIILSLLAESEAGHNSVKITLTRWAALGGKILGVPAVLEEAAYHAWISDSEYREIWNTLGTFTDAEVHHFVDNVFIRLFRREAKKGYHQAEWKKFINEYRGMSSYDSAKIVEILAEDGLQPVSEDGANHDLAVACQRAILKEQGIEEKDLNKPRDKFEKASRDGRLLAYLAHYREANSVSKRTAIVVSSAPLIRQCAHAQSKALGEPDPVLPLAACAYLLSFVPGVTLSLNTLKRGLFDSGFAERLRPFERTAMRIIRQSGQYNIGYSRRPTLQRELRSQLFKAAQQRGIPAQQLEVEIAEQTQTGKEAMIDIVASSVDQIEQSKAQAEIDQLRAEVERLMSEKRNR